VIAGSDCGFSTFASSDPPIAPSITWAKTACPLRRSDYCITPPVALLSSVWTARAFGVHATFISAPRPAGRGACAARSNAHSTD
jgi:hypothetical protein